LFYGTLPRHREIHEKTIEYGGHILEHRQKREKEIPCRQNQKFRGIDTPNESEYLPAFCVKVSDYVIFKKMREYNPNPAFVSAIDPQIQKKEDVEAQSNDVFGKQFKRKG